MFIRALLSFHQSYQIKLNNNLIIIFKKIYGKIEVKTVLKDFKIAIQHNLFIRSSLEK